MKAKKGFTLIELLTVIAIIAILAAILVPVFNRARVQAKKTADSSSMQAIHQALALYRNDQGGYPPLLLQVAEYNGAVLRNVNELRRAYLYRSRVTDINTFTGQLNDAPRDALVNACWPNQDPRPLNGEPQQRRQLFGPADTVLYSHIGINPTTLNGDNVNDPARFYAFDSYDVQATRNPNCASGYELRYTLFWTEWGLTGGNPNDNQRQLGYNNPREDTVVTWNSYYRFWSGNPPVPRRARDEMVLFLAGNVRPVDSAAIYEQSWRFGE